MACIQVISVFIYYILTRQKRTDKGEPINFNGTFDGTYNNSWDLEG